MRLNAIQQVEEAIFLLRRQDVRSWAQYLLGAVPFLLTVLLFVRDMSSGYLAERCLDESLACALAFFWASAWKARFGGTMLASMNGSALPPTQGGFWRTLYLQAVLQTIKLVTLPLAIVSVLPLAWTSSFFRNAAIEASQRDATVGSVISRSAKRASVNARGQWMGVFILSVLSGLAFINLYILIVLLPLLIRALSGVETLFTRRFESFFSLNIFCAVLALTWLLADPLVLAHAVVRCFYWEARSDGRDLLAKLRPAAALLLVTLALAGQQRLLADASLTQEQLSRALDKASQSDSYGWLRLHNEAHRSAGDAFFQRLGKDIDGIAAAVKAWLKSAGKWIRRILDKSNGGLQPEKNAAAGGDVRWLLYGIAALVLIAAVVLILRGLNKADEPAISAAREAVAPDLNKENLLASDLPEEEWLRMARDLLAQGEPRLAVRAMYLSNLSFLGSRQLIQIARAKSNSIYERELKLRPRSTDLAGPFARSNRNFERAWYGFHDVTDELVEVFQRDVEAIRKHALA